MLLAVDVGNTNIVFGIFSGKEIQSHSRIATDIAKTSDEYGILFRNLIEFRGIDPKSITGAALSCVFPPVLDTLTAALRVYFGVRPLVVEPGVKTGMPILYHNPKEVGADRIVNSVAAYDEYKTSLIVVDFGTATTFDCISEKGEYLGGAIAPGLGISADALFRSASKLPKVEIVKPKSAIGKTTVQSMQSGLVFGYAGLVDGIVKRIENEMDSRPKVIATGGLSGLIAPETRTIEAVDEFLTLKGLRLIFDWNAA